MIRGSWGKCGTAVCGVYTGTVRENWAQLFVLVMLGPLGKMENSCVWW